MGERLRQASLLMLFVVVLAWSLPASAQSLDVRLDGDHLRIAVEKARLLVGEPLKKLHDGASVAYVVRVLALSSRAGSVLVKSDYRFVISYDIFEEKFQVSRTQPTARVLSHLSAAAAEAFCSEALELPIVAIAANASFWIRWEYQTEGPTLPGDPAINIEGLVDIFSRKSTKEPARAAVESGPYRLADLPRVSAPRPARIP